MDVLSAIVGPVVQSLMVPIKRHVGYLISSTKYVDNMVNKMKQLDSTNVDVKKRVESNNINNLEIPDRVPHWLEEVEKIKDKVESISGNRNKCFNMKSRYQIAREASKITLEIESLMKENEGIAWTNTPIPIGRVYSNKVSMAASSSVSDAQSDFKSRDMIFKDALEFLKQDHKTQVIALCGMGGVGKTTMMEQLKEVVVNQKMFKWVVKVVIGQTPNMFSIQQAIAEHLGQPLTENTLTIRADRLRIKYGDISNEGKILVILDDIWEKVELKDIGLSPLPNGLKLILTSRYEDICTQIAVEAKSNLELLKVPVLDEMEAQNFFSQITGIFEEDDPQLNHIGCEIVRRCGYLPLAIKLIATTLKFQKKPVWRTTLNRLKSNDLDKNVQEIIQISYDHIKEEEDKAIFLLCGLFPDDFNIPIEDLTRYAWGLKLLKEVQTLGDARDRTHTCVSNLKSANMLMDSDYIGCVKMHDLVLAFVLGYVSKGDHAWIINHGDTTKLSEAKMSQSCKRISLTCMGMSEFPIDFTFPNLLLLKLMQGDKSLIFPEDFYKKLEELEVVAYQKMHYPLLPRSPQCSLNLRTLCLHDCSLMCDLSPIGDLVNLEVLSFSNCRIRRLPYAIGKLKKLRLLDLTGCVDLGIDEGVLKGLIKLEELYLRVSKENVLNFTNGYYEELAELSKNLFAFEFEFFKNNSLTKKLSFKKLERFRISMGCLLESLEEKNMHSFENTLVLVANRSELLESGLHQLFENTEVLRLEVNDMNDFEDVLSESQHPHQDPFSDLRVLDVSNCANLKYLFTASMANGLNKLEHLTVSSCPILEVLILLDQNCRVGSIKFPKLKFVSLDGLPKLVKLCNIHNVIELPELLELKLSSLPNFTSIYSENEGTTSSSSTNISSILNKQVVIPKLETLKINMMKNLKWIWPCKFYSSEEVDASKLREIEVHWCASLTDLFPNNPMSLLRHLETLHVLRCDSIQVLFNIDLGFVGEIEQGSNNLRSICVSHSENLREIWSVKGVNTSDFLVSAFQAVESIEIRDCKSFRHIFIPTTIGFDFKALTRIYIANCGQNDTYEFAEGSKQPNVISKREEISQDNDNIAFSSGPVLRSFHHLRELVLMDYKGVDVVFEIESATNQQLPHLQRLELIWMETTSHVWKCNWKKNQMPPRFLFHNLTTIYMVRCKRIKYLFSPLMAKHLFNLTSITINDCIGIEEVVSSRYDGNEDAATCMFTHTSSDLFPHLDYIELHSLPCLKRIHSGGALWGGRNELTSVYHGTQFPQEDISSCSLYQYSKNISIHQCDALSSVIPSHVVGRPLQKLEKLRVSCCKSMKQLFEIPRMTLMSLLELGNLKILHITCCDVLEHILTSSTLERLQKLEELAVESCKAMQVIVKEDIENTTTSKVVVLPRLKSLTLAELPNLKGFLLGMKEFKFEWPLLDNVTIYGCPQMMKFTHGECITPKLKYMHTLLGKHNLEGGLNFHLSHENSELQSSPCGLANGLQFPCSLSNLIEVENPMNYGELTELTFNRSIFFPFNELLKLQNLQKIHLFYCKTEEVFGTITHVQGTNDMNQTQTVVMFPNLKEVVLKELIDLKCIWKSSQWMTLNFPNLTKLSIKRCNNLKHVFTYDMVGSLPQLQELQVLFCKNMVVIIKEKEDYETEVNEIVFPCLKNLILDGLSILKGFSLGRNTFRWPSLETLEIKACPQIIVFTSQESIIPKLKAIDTDFGRRYASQGPNSFIRTMKQQGFDFGEKSDRDNSCIIQ